MTGAKDFEIRDRKDGKNFELGDIETITSSGADQRIVEDLEGLGLLPRFRYKKRKNVSL